jgi:hypothetical protein
LLHFSINPSKPFKIEIFCLKNIQKREKLKLSFSSQSKGRRAIKSPEKSGKIMKLRSHESHNKYQSMQLNSHLTPSRLIHLIQQLLLFISSFTYLSLIVFMYHRITSPLCMRIDSLQSHFKLVCIMFAVAQYEMIISTLFLYFIYSTYFFRLFFSPLDLKNCCGCDSSFLFKNINTFFCLWNSHNN